MEELKEIYNMILSVWKHMKASVNVQTEAEWEKVLDSEYKILAEFEHNKPLQNMCASFLAAWEKYLEARGKDGKEKEIC